MIIKNQALNVLAWISLAVGIIFLLWYIFGNSPTEIYFLLPFVFTLLFKFGAVSNDIAYLKGDYHQFKENIKESFQRAKEHDQIVERELRDIKKMLVRRYHGG